MRKLRVNNSLLLDVVEAVRIPNKFVLSVRVNDIVVWDKLLPTDPPTEPENFTASDHIQGAIRFQWTRAFGIDSYDVMEERVDLPPIVVITDASPGDAIFLEDYTGIYFVRAFNSAGDTDSTTDDGRSVSRIPEVVQNLVIGDGVNELTFTFDRIPQTVAYNLFRDGLLFRERIQSGYVLQTMAGDWDFTIQAKNSFGETISDPPVHGTASAGTIAPSFPLETVLTIDASQRLEIGIDFPLAIGAGRYDLFRSDDVAIAYATDVYPGWDQVSSAGTWDYYVQAVNEAGADNTDPVTATILPAFVGEPVVSPPDFAVLGGINSFTPTFTPVADALLYSIYRRQAGGELTLWISSSNLISGEPYASVAGTYDFLLYATNPLGTTPGDAVTATATPSNDPPGPIDSISATAGFGEIVIDWDDAPEDGATGYVVYDDLSQEAVSDVLNTAPFSYKTTDYVNPQSFFVRGFNNISQPSTSATSVPVIALEPVDPPDEITYFTASDNMAAITVEFEEAANVQTFVLYQDDTPIASDILSGHIVDPVNYVVGISNVYYVVGVGQYDSSVSPSDTGFAKPSISDFAASDGSEHSITFTWSMNASVYDSYDLYTGSTLVQSNVTSGLVRDYTSYYSASFFIRARMSDGGTTYYIDSNSNTGTASPIADAPTNFQATDDEIEKIICTWDPSPEADF